MGEIYIGEGIDSSEAMRGPCDSGFHIPTKTERVNLEDTGISLGAWTDSGGSNFKDYLKIPFAGTRKDSTGNTTTQGSMGGYWSCTAYSSNDISWRVYIGTSSLDTKNLMYRTEGCSIRPFKDEPVAPDSGRTTIYAGTGNAGIFHNSTLGLISISSDGNTRITIADKNVGATTVYNNGDTLSQSNCGNYYQRGNNYGFPRTGAITISSTKADATNYGPGNYYSSSTFITASSSPYNWDSSNNKDLRGGVTGIIKIGNVKEIYVGEGIKSYEAMRGPCPEGFHIPTQGEWAALRTMMRTRSTNGLVWQSYLKMPKSGRIDYLDGTVSSTQGVYTSCTSTGGTQNYDFVITDSGANVNSTYKGAGLTIRPFKDTPVVPDSTRTVEKQGTGNAGVYRDTVNGIISISSDGTTWITIADRNLGASNINDKGNYYQRGNNYAFPNTGPVTTSNTQVNASNYGPGNYYSSSTFIYGNQDWSSVQNDNLRGGTTGITTAGNVIEVYVGTTKIREKQ